MIEVTAEALATHPFLHGMSRDHLAVLAEAAADVTFPARHRLFEDGGSASRFWLIQAGSVALDLHVPGQGRMKIDTIGMGEVLGWSWLFPPYRWAFGAVSASPVEAIKAGIDRKVFADRQAIPEPGRLRQKPDAGAELRRRCTGQSHALDSHRAAGRRNHSG
mgnify:CR=1 FL=1